jgi:hypothetical protein
MDILKWMKIVQFNHKKRVQNDPIIDTMVVRDYSR